MKMVNFRRANSERFPKPSGSPRAEVGEIDTRAPFQSVKAAVSLFGEVVGSKERRTPTTTTPRRSRFSAENVIDMETQLLLAEKEMNNIKQKLESAETTKAKAEADLETANRTLQELTTKLEVVTLSKQSAIEAARALKDKATQVELQKSQNHQDFDAKQKELEHARQLYITTATQLDAAKQELNKIRQDFDAALETKLAAFQQAAEAQLSAKRHSDRVKELTKEISTMKEATQQVKFATQQVYQKMETIELEKDALKKSYKRAKEEAEKELESSKKTYDPALTKYLEDQLAGTTAEVESLQEKMKKVHALEMDSVRIVTAELNEATKTLQLVADEECSLRTSMSSIRQELEEVKRAYENEMEAKEAEQNELVAQINEQTFRLQQLLSETENAKKEAKEMKKTKERLKMEAEVAEMAVKELNQKLELALQQAEEAKAEERKALEKMRVMSEKHATGNLESSTGNGKVKISQEEYESLIRKVEESENMSETKIAAAMAELEEINDRKKETEEKLEASLKEIEEIKAETEEAEKSAAMAAAAQTVIEGELRRRRQQEQFEP